MKIEILDKEFNSSVDENGVISYTHPDCSTRITSDYRVFNAKNGRELKVFQNEKLIGGQISSRFKGKRANFSFGRLLALMAGHSDNGYYRIIDDAKPLTLDNITTLKDFMKSTGKERVVRQGKHLQAKEENPVIRALPSTGGGEDKEIDLNIVIQKDNIKEYFLDYVPCEDNMRYQTEDGLIFLDRAKALMHQLSVDKGKELANMVMADKGGWVLAEKIYLSQVDYSTGKPLDYNFRDIYDSHEGITEIGEKTYLVADDSITQQFSSKEELQRWLKAKALVDMVADMRYNVSKVAEFIS